MKHTWATCLGLLHYIKDTGRVLTVTHSALNTILCIGNLIPQQQFINISVNDYDADVPLGFQVCV